MASTLTAPKRDEDLFADTTMTFGEHLDELRVALFKAVLGLAIGVTIGLCVADYVVAALQAPLQGALQEYYSTKAVKAFTALLIECESTGKKPPPYTVEQVERVMTEHGMLFDVHYVDPHLVA